MCKISNSGKVVPVAMGMLAAALAGTPTFAQDKPFPNHPITIIVPFPPGSTADLLPRLLSPALSQSLGVPVIVDNRPGATGTIGAGYVAKAEASGHTLLVAPAAVLATNPWLYKELPYDPQKDFAFITNAASASNVWVVNPKFPAKTLQDLIDLAKAKPGSISYASGGMGTSLHLCGEALKSVAGIDLTHVPYKGPAPALKDVVAGQVPVICDNFSNVIPHLRAGRLRALAITAKARNPLLPDVPTTAEAGLKDFEFGVWYSFVAPVKTPKTVIERLNRELVHALRAPAISERLADLGLTVVADSPEHFSSFVLAESAATQKLIQVYGVKAE
jgi:tripartite-type tricarboxylate transporter receptor subunit TctC